MNLRHSAGSASARGLSELAAGIRWRPTISEGVVFLATDASSLAIRAEYAVNSGFLADRGVGPQ